MITRIPRERERPCHLHRTCRQEHRLTNSRLILRPCVLGRRGRTKDTTMVPPREGNRAWRNGRQGVGTSHSSYEAGERALSDPAERRGCRVVNRRPEARQGRRAPKRVPRRPTDRVTDIARRDEPCALIVQARICGAPEGNPPGRPGHLSGAWHLRA